MRASGPVQSALLMADVDAPIPGLLEIRNRYGNRVNLLLGLRGMDPEFLNRTRPVRFGEAVLAIISREDFIAMKAFAGRPVHLLQADMTYFSLVTLATVGAGDVRRATHTARMLAMFQAVVGQFYVAVIVAPFVDMYSSQRRG